MAKANDLPILDPFDEKKMRSVLDGETQVSLFIPRIGGKSGETVLTLNGLVFTVSHGEPTTVPESVAMLYYNAQKSEAEKADVMRQIEEKSKSPIAQL